MHFCVLAREQLYIVFAGPDTTYSTSVEVSSLFFLYIRESVYHRSLSRRI